MNNILENIFKQAKITYEKNQKQYKDRLQFEEQQKIKKEKQIINNKSKSYIDDNLSNELLSLINKYSFNINGYERCEINPEDYEPVLEKYYCEFNNWCFTISNLSSIDIEEGIFSISNIKNKLTNEKVNYYCDLGCRNTSDEKLNRFLKFLSYNSESEYVKNEYNIYNEMIQLLKEDNYNIKSSIKFTLGDIEGFIEVDNDIYIKIFNNYKTKMVITNKKTASEFDDSSFGEIRYNIDYKSKKDITNLEIALKYFKEQINGEIGYLENGVYYNNNDFCKIFKKLELNSIDKNGKLKDSWNYYKIKLKDDSDDELYVNKYEGIEINYQNEITFNDSAQWSEGDLINKSIFKIYYNRKTMDKISLKILNYIYTYENECDYFNPDSYDYEFMEDKANYTYEIQGNYSEISDILHKYINEMIEIHHIEI